MSKHGKTPSNVISLTQRAIIWLRKCLGFKNNKIGKTSETKKNTKNKFQTRLWNQRGYKIGLISLGVVLAGVLVVAIVTSVVNNRQPASASGGTVQFLSTSGSGDRSVADPSVTVVTSQAASANVSVVYTVTGGTGTNGTDYTAPSTGTITFYRNQQVASIPLKVITSTTSSSSATANRTVIFTLSSPTNATLGANTTFTYTINTITTPQYQPGGLNTQNPNATLTYTTGLRSHLKADAGVTLESGNRVSTWVDQSGNNASATQGTDGNRPVLVNNQLGGQPVVRFDGTDDFMGASLTSMTNNLTVIVVGRVNSISTGRAYMDLSDNGSTNRTSRLNSDSGSLRWRNGSTNGTGPAATFNDTNFNIIAGTTAPAARNLFLNGESRGSVTSNQTINAPTSYRLGALLNSSNYFIGDIAEVLVYNSVLSTTDRNSVECYLASKYGLNASSCTFRNATIWYSADSGTSSTTDNTGVQTWLDRSNNGLNATQTTTAQQPQYLSNQINGLPVVRFGSTRNYNFGNTDVVSGAMIGVANATGDGTFLGNSGVNIQVRTRSTTTLSSFDGGTDVISTTLGTALTNFSIIGWHDSGSTVSFFQNGNAYSSGTASSLFRLNKLGTSLSTGNFTGDMAEVLIYNQPLNTPQRILVDNYLSTKYNLTIANDRYGYDTTASSQLVGILQESGTKISQSGVSGGLNLVENSTSLANAEGVVIGNNGGTNTVSTSDITGTTTHRWNRIWALDKTGSVDTKLRFDLSSYLGGTPANASNYQLLYRSGTTGDFSTVTVASQAISGNTVEFDVVDANLSDGYYTIGTTNVIDSPLSNLILSPTNLSTTVGSNQVTLSWTAPSGYTISDYIVEYSNDNFSSNIFTFPDGVGTGTSAVITGLNSGPRYSFRVIAISNGLQSQASAVASVFLAPTITELSSTSGSTGGRQSLQITGANIPMGQYRRPLNINNLNGTDLTNFAVSTTIDTSSLIATGKMKADCGDLRVYNWDGVESLSYWIETGCNSANTVIWFKAPVLPRGVSTFFLQYGNPGQVSEASPDNIFQLFDDFNGTTLDNNKWNYSNSTGFLVDSGVINGSSTTGRVLSVASFSEPFILEAKVTAMSYPTNGFSPIGTFVSTTNAIGWGAVNGSSNAPYNNTSLSSIVANIPTGTPVIYSLTSQGSGANQLRAENYNSGVTLMSTSLTNTISNEQIMFGQRPDNSFSGQSYNASWDWIRVRSYTGGLSPQVTLGTEFQLVTNSTSIVFDSSSAEFTTASPTLVNVTTPPNTAGLVNVSISNSNGSSSLSDAYTYLAPTISSVSTSSGTTSGGNIVTITGTNFSPGLFEREVILNNPTISTITNAEIPIKLNTSELIASSKMRSDCGDLRVVNSDRTTQLDYWIESGCNSNVTLIWVRVPSLVAGNSSIYFTYGNSTLATKSSMSSMSFATVLASTNNRLWLKANDISGVNTDDSSISRWNDKSGNNFHISQSTLNNQPIYKTYKQNNLPSVRFDGLGDHLIGTTLNNLIANNAYTTFVVNNPRITDYTTADASANALYFGSSTNDISLLLYNPSNPTYMAQNQSSIGDEFASTPATLGVSQLIRAGRDGGNTIAISKNGATATTTASGNTVALDNTIYFGGQATSREFDGEISEILFYNTNLSSENILLVETYLNAKYRLYDTQNLPNSNIGSEINTWRVNFGLNPSTNLVYNSPTSISVTVPPSAAGLTDITVISPANDSSTLSSAYTFVQPTITGITPSGGPESGGTSFTISGTDLVSSTTDYRRIIQITNPTGSTISDYRGYIRLNTNTLINSVKMRPDCGDLRVQDSDGTDLSLWIEGCNSNITLVWFRMSSLPASGKNIYLRYGNLSLTGVSSMSSVFPALSNSPITGWYRANVGTSAHELGRNVYAWQDSNGTNRVWLQGSNGNRPVLNPSGANNLPSVVFDGGDFLEGPTLGSFITDTSYTSFSVFNPTIINTSSTTSVGANLNDAVWAGQSSHAGLYLNNVGQAQALNFSGVTTQIAVDSSLTTNAYQLYTTQLGSGSIGIARNGGSFSTASTGSNNGLATLTYLGRGASGFFEGGISELIFTNNTISSTDRSEIESYLNTKYRLYNTSNLPVNTLGNEQRFDIKIGLQPAYNASLSGNTAITAVAPPGTGTVNVQYEGINPSTATLNSGYTYGTNSAPNAITDLVVTRGNLQLRLSWTPPQNNGSAITGYTLQFATDEDFTVNLITQTIGTTPSIELTGLNNDTIHYLRIKATNALGDSAWSNVVFGTPLSYPNRVTDLASILHLRLGETSGTLAADSSGNGFNGTYVNTPTLNQTGVLTGDTNRSVSFTAAQSEQVTVANNATLNPISNFTATAWINKTTTGQQHIMEKASQLGTEGIFNMRINSNNLLQGFVYFGSQNQSCTGTTTIAINTWYFVAVSFDAANNTLNCYVNGILENSAPTWINPETTTALVRIGATAAGGSFFNGGIDEAALFGSTLSTQDIADLYYTGSSGGAISFLTQSNIETGQCTPSSQIIGSLNTVNCTFALSGGSGNFIVPIGGDTTAQIDTATGVSSPCTIFASILTCNNIPTTNGTVGAQSVRVNVFEETNPPAKGSVTLVTPAIGSAENTPILAGRNQTVQPISLTGANLVSATPMTLTYAGSANNLSGTFLSQPSSDLTDGLSSGSFSASSTGSQGAVTQLFNNNTGNEGSASWLSGTGYPIWIESNFGSTTRVVNRVKIYPRGDSFTNKLPQSVSLQYYNGTSWATSMTFTVASTNNVQEFTTTNLNQSTRWRLLVDSGYTSSLNFAELELFGPVGLFVPQSGTLIPNDATTGSNSAVLSSPQANNINVGYTIGSGRAQAQDNPNSTQPTNTGLTASSSASSITTPIYVNQATYLTINGLIDSGTSQPLNGTQCTFNLSGPNSYTGTFNNSYAQNGSCVLALSASDLPLVSGTYSFTVSLPGNNGSDVTLTSASTNFTREMDIYLQTGQIPGTITASSNPIIINTGFSITSPIIRRYDNSTLLSSGTTCKNSFQINAAAAVEYSGTINGAGQCVTAVPLAAVTATGTATLKTIVSLFNSDFNANYTFETANTLVSIKNPAASSICVNTFRDDNSNTTKDGSEGLLGGVTTRLLNSSLATIATFSTNTTAVSTNCFNTLFDDTYYVEQVRPTGGTTTQPSGNASTPRQQVILGVGESLTRDFGYNGNAQICPNPTFTDVNNNGVYNAGTDTLLSGQEVRLYAESDLNTVLGTLTTNGTGSSACFTNQVPGNYVMEQNIPSGAVATTGTPVSGNTKVQRTVTLSFGSDSTSNPFGFYVSSNNLAKPQSAPNQSKPINTGIQLETQVNPTYISKSFVDYPVTARINGLQDSGTSLPLNGTGICSATFSGSSFSSPVTITGKSVVEGVCEIGNSDNVTPTSVATGNSVSFSVTGPSGTLTSDSLAFDVTSGNVTYCVRPFADYNLNSTKDSSEPFLTNISTAISNNGGISTLQTINSNSLGTACFNSVAPGVEYTLTQTAPSGGSLVSGNLIITNTPFPEATTTYDYPYTGDGSILPLAYQDDNRNGANNSEPALNGVFTATLRDSSNNIITSNLSLNGTNTFSNLLPSSVLGGNYNVTIAGTVLQITNTTNNNPASVSVTAATQSTVNFGYASNADICPYPTFADYNTDGTRQNNERLLSGIITRLVRVSDEVTVSTLNTNNTDCFNDVIPGEYRVEQDGPTGGILSTSATISGGVTTGTQPSGIGTTSRFGVQMPFGTAQTVQFGYYGNATVCPYPTFEDRNRNTTQEISEPDISGLTTVLRDSINGIAQTITTNDSTCFTQILPGSYRVVQTAPTNTTSTTGGVDISLTIGSGDNIARSFGYDGTPRICPVIFRDDDSDSTKDSGEPLLAGITALLKDGTGTTTIESITSSSNAGGCFATLLTIGLDYQVVVQASSGYTLVGSDTVTYNDVGFAQRLEPVFGFNGNSTLCVTHSYLDSDTDGSYDNGETFFSGLSTELRVAGSLTALQTLSSPVESGGNNQFCFNPVAPGNYTLTQTVPSGGVSTTGGQTQSLNLAAGETKNTTFGYTGAGTICVNVFDDQDYDTIFDSTETRQTGVNIALYQSNDLVNSFATLTTNGSESVCQQNLFPDTYRLIIASPPSGYSATTTGQNQQDIVITDQGGIVTSNFGYTNNANFVFGAISGFVYVDRNTNGVFDSFGSDELEVSVFDNDVTLVDQEIKLYQLNTQTSVYSEVTSINTDAQGNYIFEQLQPGTYKVVVPNILGTEDVTPSILINPVLANAQESDPLVITSSEKLRGNTFSLQYTARICPTLFVDKNNNTIFEPNGEDGNALTTVDNDVNLLDSTGGKPGAYFQLRYTSFNGTQIASNGNTNGYLIDSSNPCIEHVPPRDYTLVLRNDLAGILNYSTYFDTSFYNQITTNPTMTIFLGSEENQTIRYYSNQTVNNSLSSVSGRVFNDRPTYGSYDSNGNDNTTGRSSNTDYDYDNDFAYSGVELQLYRCDYGFGESSEDVTSWNLNPPTTTSASDGTYSFTNIPPGAYAVLRTDEIGQNLTYFRSNFCLGITSSFNYIFWNNRFDTTGGITPGTQVVDYDIKVRYNSSIDTIIYYDQNFDNQRNSWETNGTGDDVTGAYELRTSSDNDLDQSSADNFDAVPDNTYDVALVEDSTSYSPVESESQLTKSNVAINGGITSLYFGFTPTTNSGFTGRVFIDRDNDGVYEPNGNDGNATTTFDNDIAQANKTISLRYGRVLGAGPQAATAASDSNGLYSISNLPEGYYSATITDAIPSGLDCIRCDWGYDSTFEYDLVYLERDTTETQNLRYNYNSNIRINSYFDTIANGVRDETWEIDNNEVQFTLTSQDGYVVGPFYANNSTSYIQNVPAGDYTVTATSIPSGIAISSLYTNPDTVTVADASTLVEDYPFTPFTNNAVAGRAFIDKTTIDSIYDINGDDGNGSTVFDNETPITGSTVYITGPLGAYSASVQSDGTYSISNLPSGRYILHKFDASDTGESNPIPDVTLASTFAGNVADVCIKAIACKFFYGDNTNWAWPTSSSVTAIKNGVTLDRLDSLTSDITYAYTNEIRLQCIDDVNGNGQITTYPERGYTETTITGCTFQIIAPTGETLTQTANQNVVAYHYPPGQYTVTKLANAAGRVNTNTQRYSPSVINYGNQNSVTFSFLSGSSYQNSFYNFFQFETPVTNNASIVGKVFIDRNNDGFYQPNGIDGNSATLEDNDLVVNGVNISVTGEEDRNTTTNTTGRYQVTDLPAGEYTIDSDLEERP